MESLIFVPTFELFIILEPFRARFQEFLHALAPLTAAAHDGPLCLGADALHRGETDVALLALRFDERTLSAQKLAWVIEQAAATGLPVLDPSRLGEQDRREFYDGYLPGYETRIEDRADPEEALLELGRALGLAAPQPRRPTQTAPRPPAGSASPPPARGHRRVPGRPGDPEEPEAPTDVDPPASQAPVARGKRKQRTRLETSPETPLARGHNTPPPTGERAASVNVRFLRGDEWVAGRLRSLGVRGAQIATSAPPRLRDTVRVAIGLQELGAVVLGSVIDVGGGGAPGFRVAFPEEDGPQRRQLISLLIRARDAGLALRPPPPRTAARFPVRWPLRVMTEGGQHSAAALDVSARGLFVALSQELSAPELHFLLPLDNGEPAIRGRARIAREVDPDMAASRGLARGYGLQILALSRNDDDRYQAFLARVRQRSQLRLVVAASPERASALAKGLTSAGYAVSSGTDPRFLARQADQASRPPDAAVIDASVGRSQAERWLRSVFESRSVPCVSTREEEPDRARERVDQLLQISR